MSIGPTTPASAFAGTPLAQTRGDRDRAAQHATDQRRHLASDQQAEQAAGVGQTDGEDHQAGDRDADGRRLWEEPPTAADGEKETASHDTRLSRDASGDSGGQLDLCG